MLVTDSEMKILSFMIKLIVDLGDKESHYLQKTINTVINARA